MKEFKNTTVLTKKDFNEVNFHMYFKTPLYVVLLVVCLLTIIVRLIDYFVYRVVNLSAVIPFVLAIIALVIVYFVSTRSQYKQNFKNGKPLEFNFEGESGGVFVTVSNGASAHIKYATLYKSFITKNCFVLRSRSGSMFIIKKSGFTEGSAEEFEVGFRKLLKGEMPIAPKSVEELERLAEATSHVDPVTDADSDTAPATDSADNND